MSLLRIANTGKGPRAFVRESGCVDPCDIHFGVPAIVLVAEEIERQREVTEGKRIGEENGEEECRGDS